MNRSFLAIVAFATLTLVGCENGYSKFFVRAPGATPEAVAAGRSGSPPATPSLERTDQAPKAVVEAYARHGYGIIGYSSFTSGRSASEDGAIKQGQAVGADLVVVMSPKYAGSVTTSIPITTPTSQTAYTTGTATAYGSNGGSATAYGNATTTTYGSRTTYIPMTVNREEFGAIYFVKEKYSFGASWRELTNDERQQIQSNSGLYITSIIDDSPAFNANVLVGDILLTINGRPVGSQEQAMKTFRALKGQTIQLTINRAGQLVTKSVTLLQ